MSDVKYTDEQLAAIDTRMEELQLKKFCILMMN